MSLPRGFEQGRSFSLFPSAVQNRAVFNEQFDDGQVSPAGGRRKRPVPPCPLTVDQLAAAGRFQKGLHARGVVLSDRFQKRSVGKRKPAVRKTAGRQQKGKQQKEGSDEVLFAVHGFSPGFRSVWRCR